MAVENFGGSTHPDILAEKTLADGDNKSLLLMRTELIVVWLYDDDVYLNFSWINDSWLPRIQSCLIVGEDLLSDTEVGNPRDTHAELSHVARLLFLDFV